MDESLENVVHPEGLGQSTVNLLSPSVFLEIHSMVRYVTSRGRTLLPVSRFSEKRQVLELNDHVVPRVVSGKHCRTRKVDGPTVEVPGISRLSSVLGRLSRQMSIAGT